MTIHRSRSLASGEVTQREDDSIRFERITIDPAQMVRSAVYPGSANSGGHGRRSGGPGDAEGHIVTDYPDLEAEDVRQALASAAAAVDERQLPLLTDT